MVTSISKRHDLLSYVEAAEVLGTAASFVERLVAQRRLAHIRLGRYVRIHRTDLDEFVANSRVSPNEEGE